MKIGGPVQPPWEWQIDDNKLNIGELEQESA